jgi:hypothetical protein
MRLVGIEKMTTVERAKAKLKGQRELCWMTKARNRIDCWHKIKVEGQGECVVG